MEEALRTCRTEEGIATMWKRTTSRLILTVALLLALALPLATATAQPMMGGRRHSMTVIDSEYAFLVHMIPHHAEAIATASDLKDRTDRQEMRTFAESIIRSQTAELEQMSTWLTDWYPQQPHEVDYHRMMRNLDGLTGDALDRAFLEDMIPHHMEAVMMSQQLLARGLAEREEVAHLASSIRTTQRDEIHQMNRWLSEWFGGAQSMRWRDVTNMVWDRWANWLVPGLVLGIIGLLALVILVIWLVSATISKSTGPRGDPSTVPPREVLDTRYARGEISREEYLAARKDLEL